MPAKSPLALVVDDEKVIADTLVLVLRQHGFDAKACYSPSGAIELLKTLRPDFLIADVVLNESSSGIDIAVIASQLAPSCKVILISGNAATADLLETARLAGYTFPCLAKPLHPKELLDQMRPTSSGEGPLPPTAAA